MSKSKILFFDDWPGVDFLHASGAGMGSSLFKLAAIHDTAQHYKVDLLTNSFKRDLLEGAEGIHNIFTSHEEIDLNSYFKIINLGLPEDEITEDLKDRQNYSGFDKSDHHIYKNSAHIKFWREFTSASLKYDVPDSNSTVKLHIEPQKIALVKDLLPGNFTRVGIPVQSISPLKHYQKWAEVIDLLLDSRPDLQIILLGDSNQPQLSGERVINLCGKTDIQLLKAVISQVDVLAGVDGLATNISMALGIPSVVLFTMISPQHVIEDLESDKITPLTSPGCPYQFCYSELINYREGNCQYLQESDSTMAKCLEFSPELIVKSVLSYFT